MSEAEPQGVFFIAQLPLKWAPLAAPPAFVLQDWMQANVALLRGLATIEAMQGEKENELGPAAAKALERLEAKVDMALTLLAGLLANHSDFPPPVAIALTPDFIQWTTEKPPRVGEEILLSLYLSRALPSPLLLPARVTAAEQHADGAHVRATFLHFNEEMADWLERTVFRYHRRAIHARQGQQGGTS